jgi:hypothetical protein
MRTSTRRLYLRQPIATAPLAAACGVVGRDSKSPGAVTSRLRPGATVASWNGIGGAYPGLMQRWATDFQQRTGVSVEVTGAIGNYEARLTAGYAAGPSTPSSSCRT